ncbi:Hypothetical protein, putative [Bodo saltans]|uniref:Reverse transcriptase domain-containing protein n=1 Tax=Bodo saltans TaxID=75058 RepID=A0A0S4J1J2_BODSA|nr:Hypothetical protein, putative [Bodo saltans]|eukprot:CUG08906.1 Hypothetical protein, putative [Bodo saltans]
MGHFSAWWTRCTRCAKRRPGAPVRGSHSTTTTSPATATPTATTTTTTTTTTPKPRSSAPHTGATTTTTTTASTPFAGNHDLARAAEGTLPAVGRSDSGHNRRPGRVRVGLLSPLPNSLLQKNLFSFSFRGYSTRKKPLFPRNPPTTYDEEGAKSTNEPPCPPTSNCRLSRRPSRSFLSPIPSPRPSVFLVRGACGKLDGSQNNKNRRQERFFPCVVQMGPTQDLPTHRAKKLQNLFSENTFFGSGRFFKTKRRKNAYNSIRANFLHQVSRKGKNTKTHSETKRFNVLQEPGTLKRSPDGNFTPHLSGNVTNVHRRVGYQSDEEQEDTHKDREKELSNILQRVPLSGSNFLPLKVNVTSEKINKRESETQKFVKGVPIEKPDYSLPLYAPLTKKITCEETEDILVRANVQEDERKEVMKWLTDKHFYEKLLRNTPSQERNRHKNYSPPQDVEKMIASQIIEKVVDEKASPSKCFVKQKSVNERKKTRRRVILETRELNRAIKKQKHFLRTVKLPVQSDIERCLSLSRKVDSFDFKSFFYQILLDEKIRPFFRLIINDELYQLCVLPMGASFSVFVAQSIANACCTLLKNKNGKEEQSLTYVDNIFFFHNEDNELERDFENLPEIGDFEINAKQTRILGRMVDLEAQEIRLAEETIEKMKLYAENTANATSLTLRYFLRIWGTIIFAASVLHLPLYDAQNLLSILSQFCSAFINEELHLDENVANHTLFKKSQQGLAELLSKRTWAEGRVQVSSLDDEPRIVVYTDATLEQGAYVILDGNAINITVLSFPPPLFHINENEGFAAAQGIKAASALSKKVTWVTDSQAVFFAAHNGRSRNKIINAQVRAMLETRSRITALWVPSDDNLADAPTRNKEIKNAVRTQEFWNTPQTKEESESEWKNMLYFGKYWRRGD